MIELHIHTEEKQEELEQLILSMAKFQGVEAKVRRVLRIRTESEDLAKSIRAMLPGKVVQIITGKTMSMPEPCTAPSIIEPVIQEPEKPAVKEPIVKPGQKHCAGCGEVFMPIRKASYRCEKCASKQIAQKVNCCKIEDPAWPEGLISRKLLIKKLAARELTPGAIITYPSGKRWLVQPQEDGRLVLGEIK